MCGVYGDVFVRSCVVNENRVHTHRVLLTNSPGSSRWRNSDVILQGWGDQEEITISTTFTVLIKYLLVSQW